MDRIRVRESSSWGWAELHIAMLSAACHKDSSFPLTLLLAHKLQGCK